MKEIQYKRRLITLPADLNERLSKERNASSAIATALEEYYELRDRPGYDLSKIEGRTKLIQQDLEQLLQLAGGYH